MNKERKDLIINRALSFLKVSCYNEKENKRYEFNCLDDLYNYIVNGHHEEYITFSYDQVYFINRPFSVRCWYNDANVVRNTDKCLPEFNYSWELSQLNNLSKVVSYILEDYERVKHEDKRYEY